MNDVGRLMRFSRRRITLNFLAICSYTVSYCTLRRHIPWPEEDLTTLAQALTSNRNTRYGRARHTP